ncbi:MAG: cytochrome P450 [Pseudomonadota bacterium]|nr:cytochrome P450 [Pseudomonadota bacterium]
MVNDCCKVLNQIIDQSKTCSRSDGSDQSSIFSLLANAEDSRGTLTRAQIRAELLVILLGGTDTTASTMSWIMAWIMANESVRARLGEELLMLRDQPFDGDNIDKLEYLDAVIKESCRISPMLFNSSARLLTQPLELGGYRLPAGTIAASCSYLVHTRPDNYPTPMQFDPKRFWRVKPDSYRWVPFGGGIRRCTGMAFALYEIKVVIASLLRLAKLEPVEVTTEPELQGTFFAPAGGVKVRIR